MVQSSPSGLTLQVDGANCVTPCNVDRANGATFKVTAPTQIANGAGARDSTSVRGPTAEPPTIPSPSVRTMPSATASYNTFYQLSASSNPGNGSAFKFSPSSSDMFYKQGTQVTVTAVPNPGFKFGHWSGDSDGQLSQSGAVTLFGAGERRGADGYGALYRSRRHFERRGPDAQRRRGARIDHFDLRPEPGVRGPGWPGESVSANHRRHHRHDQRFHTSAALRFPDSRSTRSFLPVSRMATIR